MLFWPAAPCRLSKHAARSDTLGYRCGATSAATKASPTIAISPGEVADRTATPDPVVRFSIVRVEDYLRAELVGRKTAEETREFLEALAGATLEHAILKLLICVNSSLSIFKVEQYGASAYMKRLAARPAFRVALIADNHEVRVAHQYVELLAKQSGANVRSFGADESAAVRWLSRVDWPVRR